MMKRWALGGTPSIVLVLGLGVVKFAGMYVVCGRLDCPGAVEGREREREGRLRGFRAGSLVFGGV